ncbi:hypothetical protein [Pelagibacterium lacus]|uniref:Surface antigen domain-containing protein n=1 Tax=Pelagibacterium lacus TaxID=2282655 RepID=A0A369W8S0_9HYPH|nr:hypothetical protein [Pelagibacterium lacus]RDE10457.1 hypothetical protein DVH29_00445 [Pelagibacterium lacus]
MKILRAMVVVGVALTLAACSRTGTYVPSTPTAMPQPSVLTNPLPDAMTQPTDTTPLQQARLDPGNYAYLEATARGQMTPAQRSAANDAQFYALQFGRPGAPRNWSAGGATGQVSVGPYVRVNNLDCREFSHRVTIGGQTYTASGQACREVDGAWTVSA